ncbi:hypothetical protein BOC40_35600 [Burkholderia pseudomallei]|nr:hypothetical protein BOC35_09760 [Burkholderia pseudomallei]ARK58378.1 hypothetical protein BOC36_26565 [Burkholderia pseudomallei]ARK61429.1 hypothetical protein BOC37_15265 [Burkholderia pseudomallei]ARK72192.1 hypothetical protein BOC38_34100 [Burkholderia pseudomallei]ARK75099.1 hypothetical protein BOC39_14270 [Burkholderia pseudomallei]
MAQSQVAACLALRARQPSQDFRRLAPARRDGHSFRLNFFRPSIISFCSAVNRFFIEFSLSSG